MAPGTKALARAQIAKAISAGGFGKREIWIRTSALDTPFWADDVKMAAKAKPHAILVPKVSSVDDIRTIGKALREAKRAAVAQVERRFVTEALAIGNGNISEAARMCNMQRATLSKLVKKHAVGADAERTKLATA